MREVQLREAKAKLSAMVDAAEAGEGSIITRHGKPVAVVIGIKEWERRGKRLSFGELLAMSPLRDEDLPPRDPWVPQELGD